MTYIPRSSNGKDNTTSHIPRVVKKKRTFRVFSFLGTIMLVAASLSTAAIFFLEDMSNNQLSDAKINLSETSDRVGDSKAKINEIRMYNQQLQVAAKLLDNHLAPSLLFTALELNTKETIQYRTFLYEYDPGFEALLTLSGDTEEFTSVVLQKMQLNSTDSPFEVVIVNNLIKEQPQKDGEDASYITSYENGKVSFSVTGLLKESRFEYAGEEVSFNDDISIFSTEETTENAAADETQQQQQDVFNEDNQ